MDIARKLVNLAGLFGADAVKFQKRTVKEVFTKEMLIQPQTHSQVLGKTYEEYRQKQELTDAELTELKHLAYSLGLAFFVTPFDMTSANTLSKIGMDAWKISSFDVNHAQLIEYIAKQNQPIFISTGMSTLEERDEAINMIKKYNNQLIINHCVSIYPTPDKDLNLGAIPVLKERYKPFPIGYSGHEVGYVPTVVAVALGANTVERHFTLDKSLPGPDHSTISLDPIEFGAMIREIRRAESGISDSNIYIHEKEIRHREKHGKSIVAKTNIPAGSVIDDTMITFKSPGYGIKPTLVHTVIGRQAKENIEEDTVLLKSHLA